jgi:hypothetical protein
MNEIVFLELKELLFPFGLSPRLVVDIALRQLFACVSQYFGFLSKYFYFKDNLFNLFSMDTGLNVIVYSSMVLIHSSFGLNIYNALINKPFDF